MGKRLLELHTSLLNEFSGERDIYTLLCVCYSDASLPDYNGHVACDRKMKIIITRTRILMTQKNTLKTLIKYT